MPSARRSCSQAFGFAAEQHPVPEATVRAAGLQSITNLIVRRRYRRPAADRRAQRARRRRAARRRLDARPLRRRDRRRQAVRPRGGREQERLRDLRLRGARARSRCGATLRGGVELHFTYDEEFGGELGPGWLLAQGLTQPDLLIAAGFSYQVVTAHNGCLQLEVTVHGKMAHAALSRHRRRCAAGAPIAILTALYAQNERYASVRSQVPGITHPYLNVGRIEGGTNTNVVPGKVVLKLDRRMIPEEDPARSRPTCGARDRTSRGAGAPGDARRHPPHAAGARAASRMRATRRWSRRCSATPRRVFGEPIPSVGTPLYTDVRLYGERRRPGGDLRRRPAHRARESNAKRADEHVVLEDLRRATKVIARTLLDLLR